MYLSYTVACLFILESTYIVQCNVAANCAFLVLWPMYGTCMISGVEDLDGYGACYLLVKVYLSLSVSFRPPSHSTEEDHSG